MTFFVSEVFKPFKEGRMLQSYSSYFDKEGNYFFPPEMKLQVINERKYWKMINWIDRGSERKYFFKMLSIQPNIN